LGGALAAESGLGGPPVGGQQPLSLPPPFKPAPRDGLGASVVALPAGPWPTVLAFLCQRFPQIAQAQWQARMARGDVLDAAGHPLPPDAAYRASSKLWYWREPPAEQPIPFEADILFQDDCLVVADKPHFLATTPSGRHARETLLARLQQRLGIATLVPIHRLDRETAGIVAFCVQPQHRNLYQALLRERRAHKVYQAIAPWRDDLVFPQERCSRLATSASHFMQMTEVEGVANAHTRIELLERHPQLPLARYRLLPSTGQTHQLRVHMLALGLPLLGDRIYPVLQAEPALGAAPDFGSPLQLLASELSFTDPVTGAARHFLSKRSLEFPGCCSSMPLSL
jgi:tRNA pseudouridine32 synthase/23S rRNA pseudouridine746 synthase